MAIQGVTYDNQKVSADDHAALFQMFITDGIISGCGASVLRNTLTISSGMFILAGRLTKIIGSEQIVIPDSIRSVTKKLIARCDLTKHAEVDLFDQVSFELVDTNYELRKENINTGNGQYYEVEWAELTIDAQGNITNCAIKIGSSSGTTPGGNSLTADDFTFDENKFNFATEGSDWELAFLSSGQFELKKDLNNVDIFIIGAGFDGDAQGGDGGYYKTFFGDTIKAGTYPVVIGETNGAISSIGEKIVSSADAHKNGAPSVGTGQPAGENGDDGEYAFGDSSSLINPGRRYGAGGGAGAVDEYEGGTIVNYQRTLGGTYGAGNGRSSAAHPTSDSDAKPNSGSGGGGKFRKINVTDTPGKGGSGIILIRPARAAS